MSLKGSSRPKASVVKISGDDDISPGKERAALPLDALQKQKLREWMKSKGIRPTCASCGESDWGAGEMISSPVLTPEGVQAAESHVPMVQLICINCSYVMIYAAVPIGLP